MEIISKRSQIQLELTSDEVNALKYILDNYDGGDYRKFADELHELIN